MTRTKTNPAPSEAGGVNPTNPDVNPGIQTQSTIENSPVLEDPLKEQPASFLPDNRIAVVIPYVKSLAQGHELRFALASLEKFLRFPFKVVVVGDAEDWFSEEIIHLPCERISDNPQIDVLEKLKLAIASDLVSDKFIWTNDDIYLISPVTMADLEVLKVKGFLDPQSFAGIYRENIERTIKLLSPIIPAISPWDFGTHTPVVYDKERWVEIFEEFPDIQNGGYLLSSVYFNLCYGDHIPVMLDYKTDNWLLPIKSKNPDKEVYNRLVKMKKFMNNAESGYSAFLEEQLMKLFSAKSRFEK